MTKKVPRLQSGDRVRLDYDPKRKGMVVATGPQQSEVRWDGHSRGVVYVHSNRDLIRLVERVRSKRNAR